MLAVPDFKYFLIFLQCISTILTFLLIWRQWTSDGYDYFDSRTALSHLIVTLGFFVILKVMLVKRDKKNRPDELKTSRRDLFIGYGSCALCGIFPQFWFFLETNPNEPISYAIAANLTAIGVLFLFVLKNFRKYEVNETSNSPKLLRTIVLLIHALFFLSSSQILESVFIFQRRWHHHHALEYQLYFFVFFSCCTAEFFVIYKNGITVKNGEARGTDEPISLIDMESGVTNLGAEMA